jgi:hypothetical protein
MGGFDPHTLISTLEQYLVAGHTAYVIVPDLRDGQNQVQLQLVPYPFIVEKAQGLTLSLAQNIPPFDKYIECLQGHEVVIKAVHQQTRLVPTIVDNLHRTVCGYLNAWKGHIYLLHAPAKSKEAEAFRIIVEHFKPDFVAPEPEAPPSWASTIIANLPGIREIEKSVAELKSRVTSLEGQIDSHLEKKQQIEKWAELLWLDGVPLQNRVREAFDFLGFQTESVNPTGHTHDLVLKHSGYSFYAEVTGSTGSIKIDKGRECCNGLLIPHPPRKSGVY